jgi:hypothetical protein
MLEIGSGQGPVNGAAGIITGPLDPCRRLAQSRSAMAAADTAPAPAFLHPGWDAQYRAQGYVVLRSVFSAAEIAEITAVDSRNFCRFIPDILAG